MTSVDVDVREGGAYWRVRLGGSRGNILDAALMRELTEVFTRAAGDPGVKVLCLEGQGDHFSFGASVQEHLPAHVRDMLATFDRLLFALLDSRVMTLAAVRGRCLGGALELVTLCHRVFAATGASFAQPEIALGVFAPVASVVLADRIGRGRAEDLCLSGRSIPAAEAHRIGLVDEIAADPGEAASAYAHQHVLVHSASSLRLAVEAIRAPLAARLRSSLPDVEHLYLERLMATEDAVEGLQAFLDKRPPVWRNR